MRVLVTGACGQLGYAVSQELAVRETEYLGLSAREMDVTDRAAVQKRLLSYRPNVVINCAAYTKVDQAEDKAGECWAVNVDGVRNLAEGCGKIGAKLVHLSTDYVFSGEGDRPYEPDDCVKPLCVYGQSKLAGELAVRSFLKESFIVRTSWAFGKSETNFVRTMLRLADCRAELDVVCDQIGSPTYTVDLASLLCDMAETEKWSVSRNERGCVLQSGACPRDFSAGGETGPYQRGTYQPVSGPGTAAAEFQDEQGKAEADGLQQASALAGCSGKIFKGDKRIFRV